jgi:hypothetical protein
MRGGEFRPAKSMRANFFDDIVTNLQREASAASRPARAMVLSRRLTKPSGKILRVKDCARYAAARRRQSCTRPARRDTAKRKFFFASACSMAIAHDRRRNWQR